MPLDLRKFHRTIQPTMAALVCLACSCSPLSGPGFQEGLPFSPYSYLALEGSREELVLDPLTRFSKTLLNGKDIKSAQLLEFLAVQRVYALGGRILVIDKCLEPHHSALAYGSGLRSLEYEYFLDNQSSDFIQRFSNGRNLLLDESTGFYSDPGSESSCVGLAGSVYSIVDTQARREHLQDRFGSWNEDGTSLKIIFDD